MPHEDFAYQTYIPSPILDDIQNKIHALLTPGLVGAATLLNPSILGTEVQFVDFTAGDLVYSNYTFLEAAYNLAIDFDALGHSTDAYYLYVDHELDGAVGPANPSPNYEAHLKASAADPGSDYLVLGTVDWNDGTNTLSNLVDLRENKFGLIDLLSLLIGTYKTVLMTAGAGATRSELVMAKGKLTFQGNADAIAFEGTTGTITFEQFGSVEFNNGASQIKFDDQDNAGGNSIEMHGDADYVEFQGDNVEIRSTGSGMKIIFGTGNLHVESGDAPADPALYGVYQDTITRAHGRVNAAGAVQAGAVNVASASWAGNACTVVFGANGVGSNRTCVPACEESGNTDAFVAKVDSISSTQVVIRTYQLNLSANTIAAAACDFHFDVK